MVKLWLLKLVIAMQRLVVIKNYQRVGVERVGLNLDINLSLDLGMNLGLDAYEEGTNY